MISRVYLWQNGMLMVFDGDGQQIETLQRRAADCAAEIYAQSTDETRFFVGCWNASSVQPVSREEWKAYLLHLARQFDGKIKGWEGEGENEDAPNDTNDDLAGA